MLVKVEFPSVITIAVALLFINFMFFMVTLAVTTKIPSVLFAFNVNPCPSIVIVLFNNIKLSVELRV